jgi:hypothetical protein
VLVLRTLGARRRHLLRGRRPKRDAPEELDPEPVPVSRATAIAAQGVEDEEAARRWLERCRNDEESREREVERGLALLNRAIHAYRLAAGDPYAREVTLAQAQRVRLGYGSGQQVADGRWSDAYTMPTEQRRAKRRELLAPHEELARIMGGRRPAYPSEELALRARLDLDHGRVTESALQASAALDALAAETSEDGDERLRKIAERRARAHELADSALRGQLAGDARAELEELVTELGRALRRRRHA